MKSFLKTIAFLDAGTLRPSITSSRLSLAPNERFDWELFQIFLNDQVGGLFDSHFFDAISPAMTQERDRFHNMLRRKLGFRLHFTSLREKDCRCPSCGSNYTIEQQKGVDVAIAIQMLKLSDSYDEALLCSGDGDFGGLLEYLRDDLGKRITVVGWKDGISGSLKANAHEVIYLDEHYSKFVGKTDSERLVA